MVIDFGTATTFSCVNHQGHFCGVAIAPGVHLSLQALYQGAASLPRVGIRQPARVIGKNTVESMQSGIFWGYLSMVEGMITRIHAEQRKQHAEHGEQTELKVIATGGLGRLFARETPLIHHYEPDLTLRGLQIIYERLKNQAQIWKN
jgi:type III pantothenate kinase